MSIIRYVRHLLHEQRAKRSLRDILSKGAPEKITRQSWPQSLTEPSAFYELCVRYFHTRLPAELQAHRKYFTQKKRGFGEEAFHVMWFLLFREFKFRNFLEIGVYRGQTVSLAALLQRHFSCQGKILGISPFTSAGDSVSKYIEINYYDDTLRNFAHFSLPEPSLLKAFSTDQPAIQKIREPVWDCIYIDGNHEYDVARHDFENASQGAKPGGLIVLDDSALSTSFRPPEFATGGHPGPSRLAQEIKEQAGFEEILQVGHNRVFLKR